MPFLPNLSPTELVLIIGLAAFSGIAGGVAGYGTGALMPLVLVPIVGAAPVVPIIAVSAMFTNTARIVAFQSRTRLVGSRHLAFLLRPVVECRLQPCLRGPHPAFGRGFASARLQVVQNHE